MNMKSFKLISILLVLAMLLTACGEKYDPNCPTGVSNNSGCVTDQEKADKWLSENPEAVPPTEVVLTEIATEAVIAANPENWKFDENCVSHVSDSANVCVQSYRETEAWLTRMGYAAGMQSQSVVTPSQPLIVVVPQGQSAPQNQSGLEQPAPATPTTANTGPVANRLKYDETGCDSNNLTACRIAGQFEFPAIFVRRIQSGDLSLTQGIVAIQQLAAAAGVPTNDAWMTMSADPVYATFVWCPSGTCSYPTDTAFPLMGIPALANDQFKLAIVSAHSPQVPPASITEVSCPVGDCWSAPLQ